MDIETATLIYTEIEEAAAELNRRILVAAEQGLKVTAVLHFESPGEGFYECHQISVYAPVIDVDHQPPEYYRKVCAEMKTKEKAA